MNSIQKRQWQYQGWTLLGNSTAGISTSLVCPEMGVAFDVGQGLPWAFNVQYYLITHSHMDHAAGIPYIISQKALMGQKPPVFYMPQSMVQKMHQIVEIWQQLEGHTYNYQFVGVEEGKKYPLKGSLSFQVFPTVHRVPSFGYCIFREGKKLKKQLEGCDRQEILDRKSRGEVIEDFFEEPLMAFTGDTQVEFLDGPEFVRKAKVLIMEVTYIDERKTIESARQWGHIHWEELKPRLPLLQNEKIVMMHLSARHSAADFQKALNQQLSSEWLDRLVVFPRDGESND